MKKMADPELENAIDAYNNENYQTWYGYRAFGLTVVGGISLAIF